MVRSNRLPLVAWLLAALVAPPAALADAAHLFLLKRAGDDVVLEKIAIAAGEVQVIAPSDKVIDLIFPPSPGQSAGLVTPGDGRTLVARHTGDTLRVELRSPDGSKRELPPRAISDLKAQDIRVNVTGAGGRVRAAFLILGNREAGRDVGPVANMFAGRVPAAALANAYVVQTETYLHEAGPPISGTVPLAIDRWPFVKVTLPDGTSADFLVDIGAGTTVLARSLLQKDAVLEEASMVEYSPAGRRALKYAPGGATGQVQTIVGHAKLDRMMLGEVSVAGVTVDVMAEMPDLFGRPVGGILGLDVMRRCERLALTLGGEATALHFGSGRTESADALELPFALVGTHVVVEGAVRGTPVFFVLDTGAPTTFLDQAAARAAGVRGDEAQTREARGLDQGAVPMVPGTIDTLTLAGRPLRDVPCRISALAAFDRLRGEDQHVGLLGNDLFARFRRVEIDFARRTVRFVS